MERQLNNESKALSDDQLSSIDNLLSSLAMEYALTFVDIRAHIGRDIHVETYLHDSACNGYTFEHCIKLQK